jgi:hypothetical protein
MSVEPSHASPSRPDAKPEVVALGDEHCDLCGERMDTAAINAAAYEVCGFHVCTDCLEASL